MSYVQFLQMYLYDKFHNFYISGTSYDFVVGRNLVGKKGVVGRELALTLSESFLSRRDLSTH